MFGLATPKLTLKKTLCIIINIIQRVYHTWCWSLRALQTVGTEVDLCPRDIWSPLVTIGHMTTWTLVQPPGAIHPFGTSWGAGKRTQYVKEHRGEFKQVLTNLFIRIYDLCWGKVPQFQVAIHRYTEVFGPLYCILYLWFNFTFYWWGNKLVKCKTVPFLSDFWYMYIFLN